jgi:hypothetical protein
MRTTLDLPDALFREIKAESAMRGMKLKEFIAQLLESGLAAQRGGDRTTTGRRSPLPVIRKSTGTRHPARSNREIEALLVAEDAGH